MTAGVFLRTVQAKIGQINREEARRATAAVFHALRDRLTPVEAEQLAAQLPRPLQTLWRAGERPRQKALRIRRVLSPGRRGSRGRDAAGRARDHSWRLRNAQGIDLGGRGGRRPRAAPE